MIDNAKYIALVEAGIAEEAVKLIIERDFVTNQDHVVVALGETQSSIE